MPKSFIEYYIQEWLPRDSYFSIHKERFAKSFEFIQDLDFNSKNVLEVGGIGPLGEYLKAHFDANVYETKSDLRTPISFIDNFFDLILCTEVIEHIKDTESDKVVLNSE